ncbi:sigma factor-like helix-turn-helix DNA-binding protein [Paenibacillus lemnae]|uniref:sigma factor-like helix-turn-helix DNA-binding protein n=1 Tax=Paenibacillus lemnae TaxID=1330551 RepID=UPI001FEAF5FE|nr:sigma factor-like helix-turn-helix DNA-binding protein [Paenibacillus lemnae]
MLSAILSLQETLSQPMYLYYYEGFSTQEIAKVLQIQVSNVRNRMCRARKKVKLMLGENMGTLADGRRLRRIAGR